MNAQNTSPKPMRELEENLMLVPLLISIVLTLAGLALKLLGAADTATLVNQISYYAYTWTCCIGLGYCVRSNRHLNVDLLGSLMLKPLRKMFHIVNRVLGFVIIAAVFVGSFLVVREALANGTMDSNAPGLPVAIAYFAPLVGFGLGLFREIQKLVRGGK